MEIASKTIAQGVVASTMHFQRVREQKLRLETMQGKRNVQQYKYMFETNQKLYYTQERQANNNRNTDSTEDGSHLSLIHKKKKQQYHHAKTSYQIQPLYDESS
jgi:hypothetical protein